MSCIALCARGGERALETLEAAVATAAAAAVLLYAVGGGVVSIDVDLYVRISGSWGVKTAVIPFSAHT